MKKSMNIKSAPLKLGIDIGGSFVKIGVVDQGNNLIIRKKFSTRRDLKGEDLPGYWSGEIKKIIRDQGISNILCIGIGLPGILDDKKESIIESPNLKNLEGIPVKKFLSRELGVPIFIDNDVNAFTLGEYRQHWQGKYQNMLALTLGTGIGGGIIINGKNFTGGGSAGEFGHMSIQLNGRRCFCGSRGCFERYASAGALVGFLKERLYFEYTRKGKKYPNFYLENQNGKALFTSSDPRRWQVDGELVTALAKKNDKDALWAFRRLGIYLGIGCASLANNFDPDLIVIGGGIITGGRFFLPAARETFHRRAMKGIRDRVKILPAKDQDSALIGCALLCEP